MRISKAAQKIIHGARMMSLAPMPPSELEVSRRGRSADLLMSSTLIQDLHFESPRECLLVGPCFRCPVIHPASSEGVLQQEPQLIIAEVNLRLNAPEFFWIHATLVDTGIVLFGPRVADTQWGFGCGFLPER